MPHVLNTLFHLVSLATYSFTIYYTYNVLQFPEYKKFNNFDPGQNKYLTVWNLRKKLHSLYTNSNLKRYAYIKAASQLKAVEKNMHASPIGNQFKSTICCLNLRDYAGISREIFFEILFAQDMVSDS
ncbi:hypothetical protein ALC53_02354 [Atta colombica]|uniref:Uncharacterized protein n=1 Tax=Atta colombica TaxID=520822 RepID=A0A195BQX0_9HYME|nr:hypothetical protein ALC53_02354 [Atta colombica]